MGGQNPQAMMKRGMPILGQVPRAVKEGPLGQLHTDTSEFISPTPKPDATLEMTQGEDPAALTPDEQEFLDAQKVDEQVAQLKEYPFSPQQKKYEQEKIKKIKMIDKMKTIDDEYTYSVEEPLETVEDAYREMIINQLMNYDKNAFKPELHTYSTEDLENIYSNIPADFGVKSPSNKSLDEFTNPVDKPEEVSPLKKLAQSRLGLGAKIIENLPKLKVLHTLKKVREAVKKVRYLKKNRELQKANIERQRRATEDFGDYGFKLGDVQKHLTRGAEIPKMRTVTKEQLEKENAPDEWDTEEVSGPFNIQRRTRDEKALDDKLYNHPVLKRLLSQDTNTRENTAIRRLKLKKLGDGNAVLTDEQKKYLIKKFDEKGTILGSQQDVDEWSQFMPPNVMPRREVFSQDAARRVRSEGKIPKYRIPLFDSEGNVKIDERTPGAFQRYPKKIWKDGRFQSPETAPSGAVYSSDKIRTATKAAQAARWPSESIADIDDWESTYGMDWNTFNEKYAAYKKDPKKFLGKLYPDRPKLSELDKLVPSQFEEAVYKFEELQRSVRGNVAAQAMVFRGPIDGRDPHLDKRIGTLPDEITVDGYLTLKDHLENFDYSSLGDIDVKLAKDIMLHNLELAYTDFQSMSVPSMIADPMYHSPKFKADSNNPDLKKYMKTIVFKKNKTIDRRHLDELKRSSFPYAKFKNTTLPRWGDFEKMSPNKAGKSEHRYQETIKALGFTGSKVGDEAGTSTAMIDMTAIRAPWAKFDPKKKGSAKILASILAGAIVTKAQLKRLQKEGAPHKRAREEKPKTRKRGKYGKRTRVR